MEVKVFCLSHRHYAWVKDCNTNVTRLRVGPENYACQAGEDIVLGPVPYVCVPPRHYVVITDPALRDEEGNVLIDSHGQAKLAHGDRKYVISSEEELIEPFPLYPGEGLEGEVEELELVDKNCALHLRCTRDFDGHRAGDEWMLEGPLTYIPRVEEEVLSRVNATVIGAGTALKIQAARDTVDREGVQRRAGEQWLVRSTPTGAFLPSVDEVILCELRARVLTEKTALHLRATRNFTDVYGEERRAGSEWLVTAEQSSEHIPDVHEDVVGEVGITTLSSREFAVVCDPYVDGEQRLGAKELRKGPASFFLLPGESLENGIESVIVLSEDEALLLSASEAYTDEAGLVKRPGDRWMISGPREFVPSTETKVIERRRKIPLDENEGIYVRDNKTGLVRAIIGETYMLSADEELWEKELSAEVEELLQRQRLGQTYVSPADTKASTRKNQRLPPISSSSPQPPSSSSLQTMPPPRDKTRVVQFRVPHNAAVQIYDFKSKAARVVFGPELVILMPDEQYTVLSLSGDKPKRPNVIKSLTLMLGPDFMSDIVEVETSDHARLRIKLSYNWQFAIDRSDPVQAAKLFNVRDFTGDACKAIASRVRGAVSQVSFDSFHKHSAKLIRSSVFGIDTATGKVGDVLRFDANNLVITNVDIQSVEPVDASTRESLQKSVQLAIEITTQSQEARARHLAFQEEEEAKGKLERQKLKNQADAEEAKTRLLQLQAESAAVESSGLAKAEARARAEAATINGQAAVSQAKLKAEALKIESEARMDVLRQKQEQEIAHQRALAALEIEKQQKLCEIEAKKFKSLVDAIGSDTIEAIARAGPEMQAKLLSGLGLSSVLLTDGKNPVNLFSAAGGLVGGAAAGITAAAATTTAVAE